MLRTKMCKTSVGSRFATLIVLPQMRFTPTQKIMTEPVKDKLAIAASVITGAITRERSVTLPCKIATGIAEKMQPFPMEAVMTRIMTASSAAFAHRREESPRSPS